MWIAITAGFIWVAGSSYFLFFRKKTTTEPKPVSKNTSNDIKGAVAPKINLILDDKTLSFTQADITDMTIKLSDLISGNYQVNTDYIIKKEEEDIVESIIAYQELNDEPDMSFVPDIPDFMETEESLPDYEFHEDAI